MARLRVFDYPNYVSGVAIDQLPSWPNFSSPTLVSASPTQAILAHPDGTRTVLTGTGLTFDGIVPKAGTLDAIARTDASGERTLALIDQLSLPLRNFIDGSAAGIGSLTFFLLLGNDELVGSVGKDYLSGESGNDVVLGNAGNDTLDGGRGDDTLWGGDGNDQLYPAAIWPGETDFVDGGPGRDTLSMSSASWLGPIGRLDLRMAATSTGVTLFNGTVIRNVEQFDIIGGSLADDIVGGSFDDAIDGRNGPDTLAGGPGNDRLTGSYGADILQGGAGDDTLVPFDQFSYQIESSVTDTVIGGDGIDRVQLTFASSTNLQTAQILDYSRLHFELPSATFSITPSLQVVYSEIEGVKAGGQFGDDRITGSSGPDDLYGSGGSDIINGGDGDDLINPGADATSFPEPTTAIVETANGGAGTDTLQLLLRNRSSVAAVLDFSGISSANVMSMTIRPNYTINVSNFEAVRVVVGDLATAFTITGLAGDDIIAGNSHGDVLNGLGGDDMLLGEESQFLLTSTDTLNGGEGDDLLAGVVADDVLDGGNGEDTALFLGRRADYTVVERGDGSFNVIGEGTLVDMGVDTLRDIEIARFISDTA